jgi:broad specificity phosphatase PhoE
MILYAIPTAPNRILRRGKAPGWRRVRLDKAAQEAFVALCGQLRGRGITTVYASDLHEAEGMIASELLDAPLVTGFQFRSFNPGRSTGRPQADIDRILEVLVANHWKVNPAVPIRGGDSWVSFDKRFGESVRRVLQANVSTALVTDYLGMRALRKLGAPSSLIVPLHPDRIYVIRTKDATHNPALKMAAGAA